MKIILSPAKKMKVLDEGGSFGQSFYGVEITKPQYLEKTEEISAWLKGQSYAELKWLWGCSDKIAEQNFNRLAEMDLYRNLTPAVLSYEGLAYQYMAPAVFEDGHFDYVQEHLRILSAFYGVLRAMDGVTPYRLEMQAKAEIGGHGSGSGSATVWESADGNIGGSAGAVAEGNLSVNISGKPGGSSNLYDFWGDALYRAVRDESGIIVNLASREYSKSIEKYLTSNDRYITVNFCERSGDKLVTKGTYAKMARGEMVRFMAEHRIAEPAEMQKFDRLGYVFREALSTETEYVFEKIDNKG
ncbi:MAG: YaaA family protein [Emergencia sp.]|nr:YaaA family protein [Emergencia sp.]